jgi:primary-amine oxidase
MAVSIARLLRRVAGLCAAFALPLVAQTQTPQHPLDGLTSTEYWEVHDILHKSGHMTPETGVSTLLLHEPDKATVLAWKPGEPIQRDADVILEDKGQTIEARVDLTAGKLTSWNVIEGVQAPFTTTELHAFGEMIKNDPRVQEAFKKRGLTDMTTIQCSAGPLALRVFPEQEKLRIGYGGCQDTDGQYLRWGRDIEGLYVVVDMVGKKVLRVIDTGVVPMAKYISNFEESQVVPRAGTKPLFVMQPDGPSFTMDKGEIAWQNWHFRLRLDSRVGPVLNLVRYQDGDKLRSVMYEGSFSEMYVPYMDTEEGWASRSFLDAGEFTRDGLLREVDENDCPSNSVYLSGLSTTDNGTPLLRTKEACIFERFTGDPAWRHNESNIMAGRPSRELVLRAAATIGNYDYMMDWTFQQDGTIRVRVGATGIVEVKGSKLEKADDSMAPQHGTLVAPNTVAVYHDHYLCFRLDLDVDGPNNSFMVDRMVPEKIQARTRTSIWGVQSTMAKSESDAILDLDPRKPAMWHFVNPNVHGLLGYPTGIEIMPEATAVDFLSPDDPSLKVGAFAEHQLWVTPYKPDERYAAGVYVTNSAGGEGLPKWTKADRNIENTDIVAWYTLGFHHVVRIEDWPVMPTLWHEFQIRPVNFFSQNPVMDLPHQP